MKKRVAITRLTNSLTEEQIEDLALVLNLKPPNVKDSSSVFDFIRDIGPIIVDECLFS